MDIKKMRYHGMRAYYKMSRPVQVILEGFCALIIRPIQKRIPRLDPDASKQK